MSDPAVQAERAAIRAAMRAWRMKVPEAEHRAASERAERNLAQVPAFVQVRVVAGYRPVRGELDPGDALNRVADAGTVVVWPRVMSDGVTIAFHQVQAPEQWVKGHHGIWEPAAHTPVVELSAIGCFVVPGLAFDINGGRLGQGGGHYDRVMASARSSGAPVFVGFSFAAQVIPVVPQLPHDARVEWLVTELEALRCDAAP
jgi:5-formyltetrahydrofolate cyclo-ligase